MAYFSYLKKDYLLDPNIIFLNHGSFGSTPGPVMRSYQKWQLELETQPVEFLGRRADNLLYQSRTELATFLHAEALDLVYIPNATQGINIVARSLHLHPGDIILTSDHEYGAMDRTWRFLSKKSGFEYKQIHISTPIPSDDKILDIFCQNFSPNVKVLFLSHITSPTATIFPIQAICKAAREVGILTVIDGAHAPGQIPLDLSTLGADFYTGNLHKWLCAPKGSAFLWVDKHSQPLIEPLIISWGFECDQPGDSPFIDLLQWTGTRDISPFLAVTDAIRFQKENDWPVIQQRCHDKAAAAEKRLCRVTGLPSIYISPNQFAQMFSILLPVHQDIQILKSSLYEQYRIEVPVINWNGKSLLRVSVQAYNSDEDLTKLEQALRNLL